MLLKKPRVFPILIFAALFFLLSKTFTFAAETDSHPLSISLLIIALILLAAKFSSIIEKFGQPSVLGELTAGVVLGDLSLIGFRFFDGVQNNEIIKFLAELGVVILLFQIGLESNIQQMRKVGIRALLVAIVGVVVPFVLGTYLIGPKLLPGLSSTAYLFLGASLTATSVGITARVFKDLNKLKSKEAQIVLGAAVIDDVFGLIILAVVSAIAETGNVSTSTILWIITKSFTFLLGSILIGHYSAPYIGKFFSKIHTGSGMKFTIAISFGLILSAIAYQIGLAPIIGAFAAGLVLDSVHFKEFDEPETATELRKIAQTLPAEKAKRIDELVKQYSNKHVEELIQPVGYLLVPIFFVLTGMSVNLKVLFDLNILLTAFGITIVAFIGKIVAGIVAGDVNKLVVGWAMVPRGEVGLIFASTAISMGIIDDKLFSVIVIMVILSTLITPIILTVLLKKTN